MENTKRTMPVVALKKMLVMPGMLMHFDVSRKIGIAAVEQAMMDDQLVFVVAQKEDVEKPSIEDLYEVGTVALIKQMIRMPGDVIRVMVIGIDRGHLLKMEQREQHLIGMVETQDEKSLADMSEMEKKAICENLKESVKIYVTENKNVGEKAISRLKEIKNPSKLMDEITKILPLTFEQKQELLSEFDVKKRYLLMDAILLEDIELGRIRQDFQTKVKEHVDKNQREYLLREQMRVIREELGEDSLSDAEEYLLRLEDLNATEETKDAIYKEIERFRSQGSSSSETAVLRNYIETVLSLPWEEKSEDCKDFSRTQRVLEKDHYGLTKVKERILESLAVRLLNEKGDSPIICLVGPPGTGKTSIARSIADALGKKYVRICLGGVRDEAEIRGHRKTYVGAMPGRIATAMKQVGVKNPLMLLDEIDKMSSDFKGDPASAMLEVLDGEQNSKFVDHYVEIPMDLSEVFFVATANSVNTIPRPLLDRMEVIEVSSYTENEKLQIAKKYLLKKQLKKNGWGPKQISIDKKAMELLISGYTKEAGVRKLERTIGSICRKVAKETLEQAKKKGAKGTPKEIIANTKIRVTVSDLEHYLGKQKYRKESVTKKPEVGLVTGLAWTSVGGTTLSVEVNVTPGKGKLQLTGKLGDVMKESAQIALTYVRSIAKECGIEQEYFYKHDFHIHVPEGATPKDGPSAGITMATALLSAVTNRKVRGDVAMTGEISLRGRVLPIGGLKEKLLAANQAQVKVVCVPEQNRKDVEELDEEITKGMEIVFVEHVEQVFETALLLEHDE